MYYQNKPKFNGVYSRSNLPKIKDEAYVINIDEFKSIGIYCIALYVNDINIICFDSFGVEHVPKKIKKFIGNKNVITNIYIIQEYHSIICGKFCIWFIDFMLKGKSLLNYTNLFEKRIKLKGWDEKIYCVICGKYRKFKNPKISYIFEKSLVLFFICSKS